MMEKHSLEVLGKRRYAGVHRKKMEGFVGKIQQGRQAVTYGSFSKDPCAAYLCRHTQKQAFFCIQYITLITIVTFRVYPLPRQEKKLQRLRVQTNETNSTML